MIMREWRGRVRPADTQHYQQFLNGKPVRDYDRTPGHRGTWILLERRAAETEFVVLTLWESRDAIHAFAGEDIERARYYPEDPGFLLEMPERVHHYEVAHPDPSRPAVRPRVYW
jgi:heme-degrading monooxygenase HmoA